MKEWFIRYAYAGCQSIDTPQQRLQKAIMVVIPTSISIACLFWSSGYYYFNKLISAAIPGGYAIVSMLSVLFFFKTKNYSFFRFSQILLILCLPFLLQASLGGFRSGSAVQVWALLAPIGALMFHGTRPANYWMMAFIALTIISGLFENTLSSLIPPLSEPVITTFFVLNCSVALFLVYFCVHYYVAENKRILHVINEQTNKLMEMDQIKNRFFANISHEFRTPLALTIGPLEDALNNEYGPLNETLKKQLAVMLRNSRRLLRLINQLLDISKIEAGEMKLNLEQHNLSTYLENLYQSYIPYAERKKIDLISDISDKDITALFDQEKMEKVINNLLSNAIKFTPESGRVKLSLNKLDNKETPCIRISIKDTGPGMSQESISKVFDRFYQVDGTSTREHEGTGIGLSLVKELVELHQGNVTVNSELGFGCEFNVILPLKTDTLVSDKSLANSLEASSTVIEMASIESAPDFIIKSDNNKTDQTQVIKTVLVVDDNKDIRNYVSNCLSPFYNVIQAEDGKKGLEQVNTFTPDLIVSDIMMPEMDGYEFCKELKNNSEFKHIPFIFLTAKASDDMLVEGLEKGADDYLAKPFNSKELLARVRNLITLKEQEKDLKHLNASLEQKLEQQLEELIKTKRLSSYFSAQLLQRILSNENNEELVTERRNITIFFCDLCNFTEMTDTLEVEKASLLLNEYLSEMTSLIEKHGATIIQIIGDAIMVFFGAPDDMDNKLQAMKAVELGIDMQRKISELSSKWLQDGMDYQLKSRIGIHQDYVTVGNFGSQNLMEYTAVGRGVNLASRLENSCTPGNIKVSHSVYLLNADQFPYEPLQEEQFKGFSRQVKVCELNPEKMTTVQ